MYTPLYNTQLTVINIIDKIYTLNILWLRKNINSSTYI